VIYIVGTVHAAIKWRLALLYPVICNRKSRAIPNGGSLKVYIGQKVGFPLKIAPCPHGKIFALVTGRTVLIVRATNRKVSVMAFAVSTIEKENYYHNVVVLCYFTQYIVPSIRRSHKICSLASKNGLWRVFREKP